MYQLKIQFRHYYAVISKAGNRILEKLKTTSDTFEKNNCIGFEYYSAITGTYIIYFSEEKEDLQQLFEILKNERLEQIEKYKSYLSGITKIENNDVDFFSMELYRALNNYRDRLIDLKVKKH